MTTEARKNEIKRMLAVLATHLVADNKDLQEAKFSVVLKDGTQIYDICRRAP